MTPADPSASDTPGRRLIGAVLLLLAALGVILLFKDLALRPPAKSRVDWPPSAPAKTKT